MTPEESPFIDSVDICKQKIKKLQRKISKHRVIHKVPKPQKKQNAYLDILSTIENRNLPDSITVYIRENGLSFNPHRGLPLDPNISPTNVADLVKKQEEEVQQISSLISKNSSLNTPRTLRKIEGKRKPLGKHVPNQA